jgi:hypothetical protein
MDAGDRIIEKLKLVSAARARRLRLRDPEGDIDEKA